MANGFAILSFAALLISFAAVSVMNLESIETMKFKETPAVVYSLLRILSGWGTL